jgi:uncharacterized protein YndB with AHSA1/START domain
MGNTDLGVLARNGTSCTLTYTRQLAHPPEKVWRAVTEPEHIVAWFPHAVVGDWRPGGPLRFESEMGSFDGEVVAVDPPTLLEFMWGEDRLRIELRAEGGGTLLTFTDTFDEVGKAARDGAGWHECLERLVVVLDDGPLPTWNEGWRELNARYQEALGPDASTIGPPPEWQPARDSD